jgi:hypothetical protein
LRWRLLFLPVALLNSCTFYAALITLLTTALVEEVDTMYTLYAL